ncbi:hypothetical protein I3843_08G000500 [Carya illinoinensis]|uniref:YTH domain-containing protein ECT1 isoform X2 n=1 Tax=Carya illinoinensis TaxID=32201 RepID=UPI001BFA6628|nr:YTH domain-containing protein ECT1 isoform X2 [Carya illinoinensis]KAG2691228.1 hypothetical protein I3760_08G000500 [Carya illinoinensis]KAG7965412.1 hypothetical protein I3843_08G000500 [Carya illinoinensis]
MALDTLILDTGERPVKPDNMTPQPLTPKDERIVSANPSPDATIIGQSRDVPEQQGSSEAAGDLSTIHSLNAYVSHEQNISFGGPGSSTGFWDGYSQYINTDGMHVVSPVIYNDNPSVVFHSGYGFNHEMPYGQYSPIATPLSSLMVDGQLYSPQQVPFSPSYYAQATAPSLPHMSSAISISPADLMLPENSSIDTMLFGPGSGYLASFGPFAGGNLSGNLGSSPLASPAAYPQPMGILGSYEHNVGQISQQQRPMHGYGLVSSSFSGFYPHGSSNQSSTFGGASISYPVTNDRNRLTLDKGRRRDRDRGSAGIYNDSQDIFNDRNRGPRASKPKSRSATEQGSSSVISKNVSPTSRIHLDSYNQLDFVTDYKNAKFFIIKSFSEDNVHKSVKYNVWASTPHGNKKLNAAYHEAKEMKGNCPVFLLFSVNGSGQFCGVAEMGGPVDFDKDADYWQQDRWSGQFPVLWHIIKDVPNVRFRHILLENNDNKPVTHSRDSQEVNLEEGIEMLKIFKDYNAQTSILDDFDFYDERERTFTEKKAKQACSTADVPDSVVDESVKEISDSLGQARKLEVSSNEVPAAEQGGSSRADATISFSHDAMNQTSDCLSRVLRLEESCNEAQESETGGGHEI